MEKMKRKQDYSEALRNKQKPVTWTGKVCSVICVLAVLIVSCYLQRQQYARPQPWWDSSDGGIQGGCDQAKVEGMIIGQR